MRSVYFNQWGICNHNQSYIVVLKKFQEHWFCEIEYNQRTKKSEMDVEFLQSTYCILFH